MCKFWIPKKEKKNIFTTKFCFDPSVLIFYSRHAVEKWEHATLVNSIQDALNLAAQLKKDHGRIFILGGEQIYRQVIDHDTPHCTHILLTHIHHTSSSPLDQNETVGTTLCNSRNSSNTIECDTFFPSIDPLRYRPASHQELQHFVQESVPSGLQMHDPFQYEFRLYVRRE